MSMESLFVRRRGSSTLHVRVFPARPRVHAAARAMRSKGHALSYIAWSLSIPRERVDVLVGPLAFFKISTKRAT